MRTLLSAAALGAALLAAPGQADAQRGAPVLQGQTSQGLAQELQTLRVNNARLSADLDQVRNENGDLRGRLETLEFLLNESRDEVNRMQGGTAEIGTAITALQRDISRLRGQVRALETELEEVKARPEPEPAPAPAATPAPSAEVAEGSNATATAPARTGTPRVITTVRTPARTGTSTSTGATPSGPTSPGGAALPTGSLGTLSASDLPGEAGPLFAEAKRRLLRFDYGGAQLAFESFLDQFGEDPQAGEAQYWLAETLYQQDAQEEAAAAFGDMIRDYPENDRAPDALLKLARSFRLLGENERACTALDLMPEQFPDASAVTVKLAAVERTRARCDS